MPPRHTDHQYSPTTSVSPSTAVEVPTAYYAPPSLPSQRQPVPIITTTPPYNPQDYASQSPESEKVVPPLPRRDSARYSGDIDVSPLVHYTRDPKKLVGYLVPFPKPVLSNGLTDPDAIPQRYLIYTPPPPPFVDKPKEGEKEGKVHKVQRKWQEEIREAKTSDAKTMSWKGIKGKAIRGINIGMGMTKTSNIEFLNRVGISSPDEQPHDDKQQNVQSKGTPKLEEMLLVYPSTMSGNPDQIREEFINTMMRSKSKAERDAVIATGLLPVSAAIDILITFIWPFGGLFEIDAVWAYSSIRGARTSRSITKRLNNTDTGGDDKLHLNFTPSPRLAGLEKYLAARCHEKAPKMFPFVSGAPTETEVLEAIEWTPSYEGAQERNREDEQWEIAEVKDDLQSLMTKGGKEWAKWVRSFEDDPAKAMKK